MGRRGYTLVEIMIVVAIVGMLAVIAIPHYVRSRDTSQTTACINNLCQIDFAKDRWALEYGMNTGDPVMMGEIVPFFLKQRAPCPGGGSYTPNPVGTDPDCSLGGKHTI